MPQAVLQTMLSWPWAGGRRHRQQEWFWWQIARHPPGHASPSAPVRPFRCAISPPGPAYRSSAPGRGRQTARPASSIGRARSNARASAARPCCPPDKLRRSAVRPSPARPTRSSAAATRAALRRVKPQIEAKDQARGSAPGQMRKQVLILKQHADRPVARGQRGKVLPLPLMRPGLWCKEAPQSPASRVDFPAPDGPITATRPPAATGQSAVRRKSFCRSVTFSSAASAALPGQAARTDRSSGTTSSSAAAAASSIR